MSRAVKATGEWCAPTAELTPPKLLQLLHSVRTTPDEAELEIVQEQPSGAVAMPALPVEPRELSAAPSTAPSTIELVAEIGDHPTVEELSPEEEDAIAEAQREPVLVTPTGAQPPLERPRVVKRPPAPRAAPSGSILRTLVAIVVVLGAAAGGVLIAMNVVAA